MQSTSIDARGCCSKLPLACVKCPRVEAISRKNSHSKRHFMHGRCRPPASTRRFATIGKSESGCMSESAGVAF